jgi:hypothetical protein
LQRIRDRRAVCDAESERGRDDAAEREELATRHTCEREPCVKTLHADDS